MTNSIDDLKKQLEALQSSINELEESADASRTEPDEPKIEVSTPESDASVEVSEASRSTDTETAAADGDRRGILSRVLAPGRMRIVAALVVVALVAGGIGIFFLTRNGSLPDGVALRFDGKDVSVEQIDAQARTLGALYGVETPTDKSKLSEFRKALAKSYAVSLIVDHAASKRDISIPDKTVQDVMGTYVVGQFGSGADAYDKFVQALAAEGTTEDAVRAEVRRQLVLSALFESVTKDVTVSDEEVRASFEENRNELGQPATRELSNIVVATKAEAQDIVRRLNNGSSFASLAKSFSLDGATRTKGGDLGYVSAADLDDGYAKVAFASPTGRAFGPVKTESGWNVGIVRATKPAAVATFEAVRPSLTDQVKLKKQLDVWRKFLGDQIREGNVEYSDEYRPTDPDAAPSGDPASVPSAPTPPSH